ncbi:tyrosine-type recombinase/integrase [Paenibacillus oceani]|uniref:Tyrosine-type recombinase/integrase n=1 Tax=Paenibacillus oceani TaxID=2772510 RepID=A0A927H352_9BACL|nr:tyrosine-type recombinase/integrase [Paenibacillus oceani]MBD2866510.1 tyrosine-type recombinase/integrase [Paenibacillus oceani]
MQVVQPIKDVEKIKEIQTILKKQSDRDWLLFTIGISSGLHLTDILKLKVSDVQDKTVVSLREERTGKMKSFKLTDELIHALREYNKSMDSNDYLFRSQRTGQPIKRIRVYRILNEAAKQAGLEDVGTHTMRKTYGYHVYLKTNDVMRLKELFNHSAPSVTLKYIGLV